MEIEIISTKNKITKTIINQMKEANFIQMKNRKDILGHVVNCVKGSYLTAIIDSTTDYYVVYLNWTRPKNTKCYVYRKVGKWTQEKKFDSKEECDSWVTEYNSIRSMALNRHIYI